MHPRLQARAEAPHSLGKERQAHSCGFGLDSVARLLNVEPRFLICLAEGPPFYASFTQQLALLKARKQRRQGTAGGCLCIL